MKGRPGQGARGLPPADPSVVGAVEAAIGGDGRVTRRPMFGCPAFFVQGRMFACVVGDEVGLKLPAGRVDALLATGAVSPFRPMGRPPMRQWVAVPRRAALGFGREPSLVREALDFVAGPAGGGR